MSYSSSVEILLAGNPNSGKTSIFNALTGARQRVANYPGVTVEKRLGRLRLDGVSLNVLDLPGTYSLTAYSPEERIAQEEILSDGARVVVVVADSTALRRSLLLLVQILQTGANTVLCLNMSDEAKRAGQLLDKARLSSLLGFPVVETVGNKAVGVDALRQAIGDALRSPAPDRTLTLGAPLDDALVAIKGALRATTLPAGRLGWIATGLLVGDPIAQERARDQGPEGEAAIDIALRERQSLENRTGKDIALIVAIGHQGFVDRVLEQAMQAPGRADARAMSDRIDKVLVNRVLGIPIFLLIMYAIFWVTFTLGEYPMGWIETAFGALGAWVSSLWPAGTESPLRSLLVDGIIGGVGGVVVFLPNILLLFLGLAVLEDTGYMARAAFLTDRLMHRFGLHGKSVFPMVTGFGCSIPGIMATRTIEHERDRLTTMLVLPLMSCGARLPCWLLLIPAFFPGSWRAPMLWLVYTVGVCLALGLALVLRNSVLKGEDAPFVMELPPYRLPTARAVATQMFQRGWLYMQKAGTIILGISVLMWTLTSYPKPQSYQVDGDIAEGKIVVVDKPGASALAPGSPEAITAADLEHRRAAEDLRYSVAGRVGQAIEPVIRPLGFDWRIGTALVGSFAAKEVFVAQMGIVTSLGDADSESETLRSRLHASYPPLVGLSLMMWLLISAPCMATFAVTRRESGGWKWALVQLGGLTAIGYLVALAVYQFGRLLVG